MLHRMLEMKGEKKKKKEMKGESWRKVVTGNLQGSGHWR